MKVSMYKIYTKENFIRFTKNIECTAIKEGIFSNSFEFVINDVLCIESFEPNFATVNVDINDSVGNHHEILNRILKIFRGTL